METNDGNLSSRNSIVGKQTLKILGKKCLNIWLMILKLQRVSEKFATEISPNRIIKSFLTCFFKKIIFHGNGSRCGMWRWRGKVRKEPRVIWGWRAFCSKKGVERDERCDGEEKNGRYGRWHEKKNSSVMKCHEGRKNVIKLKRTKRKW